MRCSLVVLLFLLVCGAGFVAAPGSLRALTFWPAMGCGILVGGGAVSATFGRVAAARREHFAGYTTTYSPPYHFWQLDPGTGEVLRRPGERAVNRRH